MTGHSIGQLKERRGRMISRFRHQVPTNKERKAFRAELGALKALDKSPVKLIEVQETGVFGDPIDLGIFPHPTELVTAPRVEA